MHDTDEILQEEAPRQGKIPWILALLVIAVTALAVWLVPEQQPAAPEAAAPPPAARGAVPRAAQPADTPVAVPERPGGSARALIARLRNGGDDAAGTAYDEALRQQADGHPEDAYLLYFFAARRGHAAAALALGELADPASFSPANGVLDQADPAQAYKWYRAAATAGNPEAATRLAALHHHLQAAAQDGDEQAARLLLQWR